MRKLTKNQLLERLQLLHPEYDYSLMPIENITTASTLRVYCSKHGEFNPKYRDHYYHKSKCPLCAREDKCKDKRTFLQQAIEKHGTQYDYSLVDYINNYTKIKILCLKHGIFEQAPYSHILYGNGCPKCKHENKRKDLLTFIKEANQIHKNKYDYSLVVYMNTHTPVIIICPTHGSFEQTPTNHLNRKSGCPLCAPHVKYTKRYFDTYPNIGNKIGLLYLIRMKNTHESFLKIGITKHKNVKIRYDQSPETGYEIDIINTCTVSLREAFEIEQQILKYFNNKKYHPLGQFSGQTECLEDTPVVLSCLQEIFERKNINGIVK